VLSFGYIRSVLSFTKNLDSLNNTDRLDKWIDKHANSKFSRSLFPHDHITLHSLKERIIELERMRDQILYELDRLKSLAEERCL
jgi:hypothetical protein